MSGGGAGGGGHSQHHGGKLKKGSQFKSLHKQRCVCMCMWRVLDHD